MDKPLIDKLEEALSKIKPVAIDNSIVNKRIIALEAIVLHSLFIDENISMIKIESLFKLGNKSESVLRKSIILLAEMIFNIKSSRETKDFIEGNFLKKLPNHKYMQPENF